MPRYHVGHTLVPYEVRRETGRSTVECSMGSDLELTVSAPAAATTADVEAAIADREGWILDTLYGLAERGDPRLDEPLTTGDHLPYDGQPFPLKVVSGSSPDPRLHFDGQGFALRVPETDGDPERRRRAVMDWYRDRAATVLPERAEPLLAEAETAATVAVGAPRRRFATLDASAGDGDPPRVTLHWRLLLAPRPVQAYVTAHELARVDHPPDSTAFWTAIERLVPDYRTCREWLRHNGAGLTI